LAPSQGHSTYLLGEKAPRSPAGGRWATHPCLGGSVKASRGYRSAAGSKTTGAVGWPIYRACSTVLRASALPAGTDLAA